jgi:hypothetical protein
MDSAHAWPPTNLPCEADDRRRAIHPSSGISMRDQDLSFVRDHRFGLGWLP